MGTSPALMAVTAVAVSVAADALMRCLGRTSRLGGEVRRLAVLSRTDPLTGLPNRRHVEEHLVAATSAARRHNQPLSVLFVDIDSFKQINDRRGYEAGDEVLRAVGEAIRSALRVEDVLGRWGGEEFVAVLPATDLAGAMVVGERVRNRIAAGPFHIDEREAAVTVSIGCASGGDDAADLVRRASRGLRQAKEAGKNRVLAGPPPE